MQAASSSGRGSRLRRRPAFDDVGDVDLGTRDVKGLQIEVEQLPCPPHKGLARQILLLAGPLSHKEDVGMGIADAKDHMGSGFPQGTGAAGLTIALQLL